MIFPHSIPLCYNLIKEKLLNLIEWTFKRGGSPYIACNEKQAFFTSRDTQRYKLWSCQNLYEALIYLLDNIYIRFQNNLISWSRDQDRLNQLSFPHPMETPYKIWLQSAQWFLRRCFREWTTDRRTTDDGRQRPVVVPYCYLFLLSVLILWFSYYISDIF